jgi:hypothetical protein
LIYLTEFCSILPFGFNLIPNFEEKTIALLRPSYFLIDFKFHPDSNPLPIPRPAISEKQTWFFCHQETFLVLVCKASICDDQSQMPTSFLNN